MSVRLEMTRVRGCHDLSTLTRVVVPNQQGPPPLFPEPKELRRCGGANGSLFHANCREHWGASLIVRG
jgi:hypothetical protein